jgi:regulator of protease activity HflC (stomatin/prohibitin superfamily)
VQHLEVTCETKTQDNVFVNITSSVQFRVNQESAFKAFYSLTDVETQMKAYIFDVIRSSVPKMDLDDVYLSKCDIANDIKKELSSVMSGYGYIIVQALINDIAPDEKVKKAMNEINEAARLRIAAVDKAEAKKIIAVKEAEAESESKYLQGCGISRQRQAIMQGLKDSVQSFKDGMHDVNDKEVMQLLVLTQYFDMLKDVGTSNNSKVLFIPHAPHAVDDFGQQIRTSIMEADAAVISSPTLQEVGR